MNFLLVNDDGYNAPGIKALKEEFDKIGRVVMVAPLKEQSAMSHRITLRELVFIEKMDNDIYAVDSSPADCVRLGLSAPMEEIPQFDYVISGINKGGNMGSDIYYSGTLAAAREATFLGVPSLGFSMWADHSKAMPCFKAAAKEALEIFQILHKERLFSKDLYYNINFPIAPPYKERKITKAGKFNYTLKVHEAKTLSDTKKGFFMDATLTLTDSYEGGDDFPAIQNGNVSINPLWVSDPDFDLIEKLNIVFKH